ncbi:unnamed protein product [Calypogeia fissa]
MDAELRKDLIVNRWVLISPRRGKRPRDYNSATTSLKQQASQHPGPCPFCYQHEDETGPELLAFRNEGCHPNEPCWRVRVVKNKYPAVSSDFPDDYIEHGSDIGIPPIVRSMPGFGSHEVVIETPEHDQVFTSLSVDQICDILRAYRSRVETLRADPRIKYCQIFKNNGNAAGASMVHSHSQIIALPVVPKAPEDEYAGSKAYYEKSGSKCVFCEVIMYTLGEGKVRLIDQSPHLITLAPYAPRFAYETWILPRKHNSNFGSISEDEIRGLAEILKLTLCKMDKAFNYPPFNFMIQMAPLQDSDLAYYHWYIRIVPHLTSIAGFELATGCHINPVSPESAAEFLRGIRLDDEEEDAPHSNGYNNITDITNGTTNHEHPQRVIYMADLGKVQDKNPDAEPQRVIHMADLGKHDPEKLIYMADLGKNNDPERLIYMADLGKHDDPEKLVYMADLGKNDQQPPERLIHMADL